MYHPDVEMFVRDWELILGNLLGWSKARVHEWAKHYERELSDPDFANTLFNHETPAYYVAPLLVPRGVEERTRGPELIRLMGEIESAINQYLWNVPVEQQDWRIVRYQVDTLLGRFGESLKMAQREHRC